MNYNMPLKRFCKGGKREQLLREDVTREDSVVDRGAAETQANKDGWLLQSRVHTELDDSAA